jgi:hypothetical protein
MRRIAWPDEIAVQRMAQPAAIDSLGCRHQRLCDHLPAIDTLPAFVRRLATKHIIALGLDIEECDEAGNAGGGVTAGHDRLRNGICTAREAPPGHKISSLQRMCA